MCRGVQISIVTAQAEVEISLFILFIIFFLPSFVERTFPLYLLARQFLKTEVKIFVKNLAL